MNGISSLLKTVSCRLIFLVHGVFAVFFLSHKNKWCWFLLIPFFCLAIDTLMVAKKKSDSNLKFQFFWLSGFFYISTMVPIVWLIELNILPAKQAAVGRKVCELGLFIGLIVGRWLTPRGNMSRDQVGLSL